MEPRNVKQKRGRVTLKLGPFWYIQNKYLYEFIHTFAEDFIGKWEENYEFLAAVELLNRAVTFVRKEYSYFLNYDMCDLYKRFYIDEDNLFEFDNKQKKRQAERLSTKNLRNPLNLAPKEVLPLPGNTQRSAISHENYRLTTLHMNKSCFWAKLDKMKGFEPEVLKKISLKLQKYFPDTERNISGVEKRKKKVVGNMRILKPELDLAIREYFNSREKVDKAVKCINELYAQDIDFMHFVYECLLNVIKTYGPSFEKLSEEIAELSLPEQACVKISSIPYAATRMRLMLIKSNYNAYMNQLVQGTDSVSTTTNAIRVDNEEFQQLLALILYICNTMNMNKYEPVYGFKLSFLNELENTVSGANRKMSLMTYLADVITNDVQPSYKTTLLKKIQPALTANANITPELYNSRLNVVVDNLKEILFALSDVLSLSIRVDKLDLRNPMNVIKCLSNIDEIISESSDPFVDSALNSISLFDMIRTDMSVKASYDGLEGACDYYLWLNESNSGPMQVKDIQHILKNFFGKLQMACKGPFLPWDAEDDRKVKQSLMPRSKEVPSTKVTRRSKQPNDKAFEDFFESYVRKNM